uniref:NACHT domain-containing protein n=1 Tax=Cyprinus carpio TaxID=7962 RepID=A0A8C2EGR7_CYPCA
MVSFAFSLQQERSDSSSPSVLSMKSERSMKIPIHLNEPPPLRLRLAAFLENSFISRFNASRVLFIASVLCIFSVTEKYIFNRCDSKRPGIKIQRLKTEIKKKHLYIFEGFAKQGNPKLLNEIYIELYITEGGNGEISNEHEIKRIEKTLKAAAGATIPIKCSDIFRALPGQDKPIRTVLTKGVAGIGKTFSVQRFILDWAEGKENQDVQLIFPLPFREINLMKDKTLSLSDLLHVFFPETKEIDIFSDEYKVLFIFDGLDGCRLSLDFQSDVRLCDVSESASVNVLLTNLIVGNLLPSALIWITSRPAAADLVPSECVHRVTEVRGFNDPQKEEYFRKRISDQSLADRIISHLKSSSSLFIMCHIPVFCWISAAVLEKMLSRAESGEIPKTLTQMYTRFLILQTNIKHQKDYEKKVTDEDMILKLGKLAYKQLEKGNLIFYEEDLRECGIDETEAAVYSGLCTQIFREESGLYQGKVFCFVHLSVQEHLAALYVHLSFHNSRINVLEAHESGSPVTMLSLHKCAVEKILKSMNGYLDLFLRFLMGLSLESNHSLLKGLLVKKTDSSLEREKTTEYLKQKIKTIPCSEMALVLFHCLNELNDHSLITEIQSYLTSGKLNSEALSPDLWSALVYILMTSNEKFEEFELRKYGRSDAAVFWLLPVIKLKKDSNCGVTEAGCVYLSKALSLNPSHLRVLDLSWNNIGDSGVKHLCAALEKVHCALETLKNKWNFFFLKKYILFVFYIKKRHEKASNYRCIYLIWVNYSFKVILCTIICIIKNFTFLTCHRLSTCIIRTEGFGSLASVLRSNSHLRELDLGNNRPRDQGAELLSAVLQHPNCRLKTLRLDKCGMTERSCTALASALSSKTCSLTDLDLSINDLQDSGVKKLCAGLQNPHCTLEKLRLSNCNVTHEGVTALTEALKSNPSHLKELDLSENDLEESDLKVLSMILDKS